MAEHDGAFPDYGESALVARLPRHIAEKETAAEVAANGHANGNSKAAPVAQKPADLTGHGTILLVEDEEGLHSLNARGLRSRGYTVVEARNGVEAD